ncbi:hypothetical protein JL721_9070 [Aureococcus anophagefferens]|nr:hypothetical protein JL721_9070 [Aureococcus anophagefferens]
MADAAPCLVTIAQLEQARSLLRQKKYCDCAALLVKARVDDAPATAASAWGTQTSSLRRRSHARRCHARADSALRLGLARATAADVRRAHRQLALQHHPDKTGGKTNDLFATIQAAHDDLSEALAGEALAAERDRRGGAAGERRLSTTPPPADAGAAAGAAAAAAATRSADAIWERRFWDLAEYKMRRGHCYVPAAWASPRDPPSLGDWAASWWSSERSRDAPRREQPRTEASTFEVSLFGYVLMKLDRVASYGDEPAGS